MTTSRLTIRREHARDWPMFQGMPLADEVGVLSIEILRGPQLDLASAVAEASGVLASSRAVTGDEARKLLLIVAGRSVDPSSKVAAYNAERDKLWVALEREGCSIPAGDRFESRVQYNDGSFGFVGVIELQPIALPKALEITRTLNAVCVRRAGVEPEEMANQIADSLAPHSQESRSLLRLLIVGVNSGLIVRGYGEFDDRNVGVEVFAKDEVLNRIEEGIAGVG